MPYLPTALVPCLRVALIAACAALASCHDGRDRASAAQDGGREHAPRTSALADDLAGKGCERDADCPGGRCTTAPGRETLRYCSADCDKHSDCGRNGLCVARNDGAGGRECLATCERDADCRAQFSCVGAAASPVLPVVGSCRPHQPSDQLADGVAGRACENDGECSGGRCERRDPLGASYPGNACSGRCYADAECGGGGVCLRVAGAFTAGHCLRACSDDADCAREGYRCRELGTGERLLHACWPGVQPLPDHTTGRPCSDDSACADRAGSCARELPYLGVSADLHPARDGYCTQPCTHDADCGAGAQCISRGPEGGLCLASCSDAEACRDGYECVAHLRDADPEAKVCVPAMASE